MAGLNTRALLDGLVSNALQLGIFDKVNTHEPKAAPGHGLTAAIWSDGIRPVPQASGLNQTSAVSVFSFRIYQNMTMEPQDLIDTYIVEAVDTLFAQLTGDFTLNGEARNIDLLGETGNGLGAQAGYINQDGRIFRVMDITIPIIINDAWSQNA